MGVAVLDLSMVTNEATFAALRGVGGTVRAFPAMNAAG